jgi:hypothetical protein
VEALRVVPVHPSESRELEILDALPRAGASGSADEFGLVIAVRGLGHGVVVAVADGPDRGCRADLREAFALANRRELAARIAMTPQILVMMSASTPASRLHRGADHLGAHACRAPPRAGHPIESVDDEADVGDAGPRRHAREICHPEPVRVRSREFPIDQVRVPCGHGISLGRLDPLRRRGALDASGTHQPPGLVAVDIDPGATRALPELADFLSRSSCPDQPRGGDCVAHGPR